MDELSLLEAASTGEEAVEAAEAASTSLPAPDFTGSLDYIDSLASRSALAISRRDVASIATGLSLFDYMSPVTRPVPSPDERLFDQSTDFRPLQDGRAYAPQELEAAPAALVRSARQVVAPSYRDSFPPGWRNPLDPDRSTDDLNRSFDEIERRINRHPFAFKKPNLVVLCLRRKIRRQVMHSAGMTGLSAARRFFRKPRRTYWSRVIC